VRKGARTVALALLPDRSGDGAAGSISSVTGSAEGGAMTFVVTLRDGGTRLATEARIGTTRTVGRVIGHPLRSDANRLCGELAFLSRDAVYEEALARAAQLVG